MKRNPQEIVPASRTTATAVAIPHSRLPYFVNVILKILHLLDPAKSVYIRVPVNDNNSLRVEMFA